LFYSFSRMEKIESFLKRKIESFFGGDRVVLP
jgi:hypothetical protein